METKKKGFTGLHWSKHPDVEKIRQRIAETKRNDPRTIEASKLGVKARLEKYSGSSWNQGLPKEKQPRYGKSVSHKQIKAMREIGRKRKGEPSWNRGLSEWSPRIRDIETLNKILARDNKKCVKCCGNEDLMIHHVKHWNQMEDKTRIHEEANLITLCRSCHLKRHNHQKLQKRGRKT